MSHLAGNQKCVCCLVIVYCREICYVYILWFNKSTSTYRNVQCHINLMPYSISVFVMEMVKILMKVFMRHVEYKTLCQMVGNFTCETITSLFTL
jgi:hypothetical protein